VFFCLDTNKKEFEKRNSHSHFCHGLHVTEFRMRNLKTGNDPTLPRGMYVQCTQWANSFLCTLDIHNGDADDANAIQKSAGIGAAIRSTISEHHDIPHTRLCVAIQSEDRNRNGTSSNESLMFVLETTLHVD
jgi:hypothetical protein